MRHYVNWREEDIGTVFVLEIGSIAEGGAEKGEGCGGGRGGERGERGEREENGRDGGRREGEGLVDPLDSGPPWARTWFLVGP